MNKRRKCIFNAELAKDFPFLEKRTHQGDTESGVYCKICNLTFSIANSGRTQVNSHVATTGHQKSLSAKLSSHSVDSFFKNRLPNKTELELAAKEATFAYHTVRHDQSFRSMDCTSMLIKEFFDKKFTNSRTKCQKIIVEVLALSSFQDTREDLSQAQFVSISVDCSNKGSTKLFPVLVRYFDCKRGILVKILDLHSLVGETSDILLEKVTATLNKYHIKNKLICICADNTNTNFGGIKRAGEKNLFFKLKQVLGATNESCDILGIGCVAHIINNSIERSAESLEFDIETLIFKVYKHFSIYTVRTEELKSFCEFNDIEFKRLLSSSKTRWLSLGPAIERFIQVFGGLKSYFLSQEICPAILKNFFNDSASELFCWFLHSQTYCFQQAILKVEGKNPTAVESLQVISDLISSLELRKNEKFIGLKAKTILRNLIDSENFNENKFYRQVEEFYSVAIKYLADWIKPIEELRCLSWTILNQEPIWENIEKSLVLFKKVCQHSNINDDAAFYEYGLLKSFANISKIEAWSQQNSTVCEKWLEIFNHFALNNIRIENIEKVVKFMFAIPGTSASVERVFSLINNYWTPEKTQLSLETLEAVLQLKINVNQTCSEFYKWISEKPEILKSVHSSEKYQ